MHREIGNKKHTDYLNIIRPQAALIEGLMRTEYLNIIREQAALIDGQTALIRTFQEAGRIPTVGLAKWTRKPSL